MRTVGGNSSDDALVAISPRGGVVGSQADTRRQGSQMPEGRTQLWCVPELVVGPGPAGDGLHPGVLHVRPGDDGTARTPPWRQPEGKSHVNLPQMPLPKGGICMGVDLRGLGCLQGHCRRHVSVGPSSWREKDTRRQGPSRISCCHAPSLSGPPNRHCWVPRDALEPGGLRPAPLQIIGTPKGGFVAHSYLTQKKIQVVLQMSTAPEIRQLVLYCYQYK